MSTHLAVSDTAVALANAKIHRTTTLFLDTRIQEDVRAAPRRDPRIKHPELIAISVDEDWSSRAGRRGREPSRASRRGARRPTRRGVFDVIVDDVKVHPPVAHRRPDEDVTSLSGVVGVTNQVKVR